MAVIETPSSSSVTLSLNAGMDYETGRQKTVSVGIGKIIPAANNEKIMDVCNGLSAILVYPAVRITKTLKSVLESD